MAAFGPYAVPMKICIAGGPRTGKTTLGDKLDADCRHTDDLIGKLESGANLARRSSAGCWRMDRGASRVSVWCTRCT